MIDNFTVTKTLIAAIIRHETIIISRLSASLKLSSKVNFT